MKNKLVLMLAAAIVVVSISGCGNKQIKEESIVYGDIDFDAEVVEPVKPITHEAQKETVGNTYLNLLNKGLFCETDNAWFFVIKYDGETYLIRQDKETEKASKIYRGEIRNISVYEGWLYAIVTEGLSEYMLVMDEYGNNQQISPSFKENVRTMQTNGNRVYFTVDASNVIGMELNTAIYSCAMDLSDIQIEKTTYNMTSQIDIIALENGGIYFCETNSAVDTGIFKNLNTSVDEYPVLYDGKFITFTDDICSSIVGETVKLDCANQHNEFAYIAASNESSNYLISYNMNSGEVSFEESEQIDQIYEYSKGIIIFSDGIYERIEK